MILSFPASNLLVVPGQASNAARGGLGLTSVNAAGLPDDDGSG